MQGITGLAGTGKALSWRGALQPVPLHRARVVFGGRRTHTYNEPQDQVFRDDLRTLWAADGIRRPLEGELAVVMTFAGSSRGGRRRPDVTNLLKAVEDAGNGVLWQDDRQITLVAGAIVEWGRGVQPHITVDAWAVT